MEDFTWKSSCPVLFEILGVRAAFAPCTTALRQPSCICDCCRSVGGAGGGTADSTVNASARSGVFVTCQAPGGIWGPLCEFSCHRPLSPQLGWGSICFLHLQMPPIIFAKDVLHRVKNKLQNGVMGIVCSEASVKLPISPFCLML